jgi:hypothetical protein
MPAAFQIVSRSSGKALYPTLISSDDPTQPGYQPGNDVPSIVQATQDDQDSTSWWVLTSKGSPQDFLIQPFGSPDLAIGVYANNLTDLPGLWLILKAATEGQVWRISRRLADPPYFFLLEASNDLLMDVPHGSTADDQAIQIFTRNEHTNQQWTFLPVFAQLGNDG